MPNAVKRTGTTWRKIACSKLTVQTADKIIRLTQDLEVFAEKEKKYLRWNTRGMCPSWKQEKLLELTWEKTATPLLYGERIQPIMTTNIELSLETNNWPKFQDHLKNLYSAEFYQTPAQERAGNMVRSNVAVQTKTHVGSTIPTWTTKIAKSLMKQLLHKLPNCPPKSIKDRLKILSPIKSEQRKQKSQVPIIKAEKIPMNSKVNMKNREAHSKYPLEQSCL